MKDAIQGTTLTLVGTGKTGLAMKENSAGVKTAINDFVKAYNSLQSTAKTLTAYDADTKTAAALVGDSTLRNLQTRIRQALSTPQAGGANDMKVLTEIGVAFQKDGTLASDGVTSTIKKLDDQYDAMQVRVDATVDRYRKQFNQLDVLISSLNSTKNYLTQQFEAMSNSSK